MWVMAMLLVIALSILGYVLYDSWKCKCAKEEDMTVKEFARKVTLKEGGKISISIAQVAEVLKIVNDMVNGELYKLIRKQ